MKSYDALKAEMEVIQKLMLEAIKYKLSYAIREAIPLCKEVGFAVGMPKSSLAKSRNKT